jgi:hypothetical protein
MTTAMKTVRILFAHLFASALSLSAVGCDVGDAADLDPGSLKTTASQGDLQANGAEAPPSDVCSYCRADELCVVYHDEAWGGPHPLCKKSTTACPAAACSDACSRDFCQGIDQGTCNDAPGAEADQYPNALHCYPGGVPVDVIKSE